MKYFAAQARARREEMSGVRRFFHDHAPRWRPRPGLVEGLARNLSRDKALDGLERQYQKAAKTFETQGIRLRNAEISLGRWERRKSDAFEQIRPIVDNELKRRR